MTSPRISSPISNTPPGTAEPASDAPLTQSQAAPHSDLARSPRQQPSSSSTLQPRTGMPAGQERYEWPHAIQSNRTEGQVLLLPLKPQEVDARELLSSSRFAPIDKPVTRRLQTRCRELFDQKVAALPSGSTGQPDAADVNRAAAEAAFETVRSHYKRQLKSGNKGYSKPLIEQASADRAEKMRTRNASADLADDAIGQLRDAKAPLEAYLARGVGNCDEMADAAIDLVRSLGIPAAQWMFDDLADPHGFCVVGHQAQPGSPGSEESADEENELHAAHVFVVDPWAGIQCAGSEYRARFRQKMDQWAAQGKTVSYERVHEGGSEPTMPHETLANDPMWLQQTLGQDIVKEPIEDEQSRRGGPDPANEP